MTFLSRSDPPDLVVCSLLLEMAPGFDGKFRSIAPIKCGLSEPKLYLQSKFTSKYFHYYNFIKKIKKHTHNYKWPLFEAIPPSFTGKKQQPPPLPHPIRSSPPKPCSGQPWWKSGVNRWCTPRRRRRDHPDPPLQPPECFTAGLFVSIKKSHVFFGKKEHHVIFQTSMTSFRFNMWIFPGILLLSV